MSEVTKLGQLAPENADRDAVHVAVIAASSYEELVPGQQVAVELEGSGWTAIPNRPPVGIVDPFLTEVVKPGQRFYVCLFPGTITGLQHVWSHPALPDWKCIRRAGASRPTTSPPPSTSTSYYLTSEEVAEFQALRVSGWEGHERRCMLADLLEERGFNEDGVLEDLRESRVDDHRVRRAACLALGGELAEAVRWIERFAHSFQQNYSKLMAASCKFAYDGEYTYDNTESYTAVGREPSKEFTWKKFWEHYVLVTGEPLKQANPGCPYTCSC